jgi:hypothetical protein
MRELVSYALLFLGILFAAAATAQDAPKPMDKAEATVTIDCAGNPNCSLALLATESIKRVQDYATDHDTTVTVKPRGGVWWVEADGIDAFGTGKTVDEAAEDFMHCVDVMEHEPAEPANSGAPKLPDCNAQTCS